MFKKTILAIVLFILANFNVFSVPIFENFDSFTNTSYGNYTHNGWTVTNGLSENQSSRTYLGVGRTVRLRNNPGSKLQSPSKTGGIGTIDFWYGNWDGSPSISKVYVEISSNGTSWTKIDSIENISSVTYLNYSKVVNNSSAQFVRIVNSGEERLFVDNFGITDYTSACSGFYVDSITDTICSLDSVSFRGVFRNTAGIYRDTVNATCDTIFVLNLATKSYITYDVFDTICSVNDSLLFNGNYIAQAGTYYDTTSRLGLCDSISKLTVSTKYCPLPCNDLFFSEYLEGGSNNKAIEIYNPTSSPISLSGYEVKLYANGSTSVTNTLTLTGSIPAYGVYVISNSSSSLSGITSNSDITSGVTFFNGDDVLQLEKNSNVIDVIGSLGSSSNFAKDVTLVRNSSIQQGNTTYTPSEWVSMAKDVDTMMGFHTSICQPCTPDRDTTSLVICEGDSATNGVSFYSVSGIFSDTMMNSTGCDSIRVLDLTVSAVDRDSITDTICMGATINFGTQTLTMSGNYSDTVQNTAGCDSIVVLELFVTDILRDTITDTICMGASLTFGSQSLTMAGIYSDTVQNSAGCDSITVIELSVNLFATATITDTICSGATMTFGSQVLSISGTYTDTVQNASGCDSITSLELFVNPAIVGSIMTDTICENGSISFNGAIITSAGIYYDTLQTIGGCDSILTLTVFVNQIKRDTISDTICSGASSILGTIGYTTTGVYADTTVSISGCDSITILDLYVITYNNPTVHVQSCDSFLLPTKGYVYTSGVYRDTVQASTGCDSTLQFFVTIGYQNDTSFLVTSCNSFTSPSGKIWNLSGVYRDTIMNASGCDSILNITLIIHNSTSIRRTVSSCDSYTVPETGSKYFVSAIYKDTTTNAFGCQLVITTDLTINTVTAGSVSVNGITLTANATGVSYKWLDCDNNYSFIIGNTSQNFTPVRNGSYACKITSTDGCVDTTSCTDINSVDLTEYVVNETEVSVYPNPASSLVNVEILSQNENEVVTIALYDAIGKAIYTQTVNSENNRVQFDVNELESGIYSVSVSNEFFKTTRRLVITK